MTDRDRAAIDASTTTTDPVADAPAAVSGPDHSFRMGTLGRHSMIYGLGVILTKAVSFVMLPIYTRFLTPTDYGILQLITMTLEVVSIFAGSRIAFGIFHYYHKAQDDAGRRSVLSTALLLLAASFAAAAIAAIIFAGPIARLVFGEGELYPIYIRLAAAAMAFESLILVPSSLFQLQQRSGYYVGVGVVKLFMQVGLNLVFLVGFEAGVTGVLLSNLIASVLVGGFLATRVLAEVGTRFSGTVAREYLRFGLPLVAVQIATFIYTFGDRYFLNRAGDEAAVGIYGLAYQFGFMVATIGFAPFQRVWDPQRFAIARRPDRDAIYARVFIYLNVGLVSASLALSMFSGDVLRLIAAPPFHPAIAYVPVIVLAYVFHCWSNFVNLGIYITEKTEYFTAANWAAAVTAVIGYVLLIPEYLAWGAAIATLISVFVRFWLAYVFSQRLWPVRYEWAPVLRILGAAIVIGAAVALMPMLPLLVSIPVHAAIFVGYLAFVWLVLLTPADRGAVRGFIDRKGGRGRPAAAPVQPGGASS